MTKEVRNMCAKLNDEAELNGRNVFTQNLFNLSPTEAITPQRRPRLQTAAFKTLDKEEDHSELSPYFNKNIL